VVFVTAVSDADGSVRSTSRIECQEGAVIEIYSEIIVNRVKKKYKKRVCQLNGRSEREVHTRVAWYVVAGEEEEGEEDAKWVSGSSYRSLGSNNVVL
jgi:hypothetical protein